MLATFWYLFLYQPLFNALIWIYSNIASGNLGWAVIWLTVFLRVVLLPLTFVSERNVRREEKAEVVDKLTLKRKDLDNKEGEVVVLKSS